MRESDIAEMGEQERFYWWHICRRLVWRTILDKWLPESYRHPECLPAVILALDRRSLGVVGCPGSDNPKILESADVNRLPQNDDKGKIAAVRTVGPRNDAPTGNRQILDVGCGTGINLEFLKMWGNVVGIDQSSAALKSASQFGPVEAGDALNLPRPTESIDLITAFDVLEHLPDDEAALKEWHRVLKTGGYAVISVPAYQWLYGPHDKALLHQRRYTSEELSAKLARAGFQPIFSSYAFMFTFPVFMTQRLLAKSTNQDVGYNFVPPIINQILIGFGKFEAWLVQYISLPFGSSVFILAKKI